MAMAERKNIEFGVEGGVALRGWLFVPGAKGPAPAITMAHGYARCEGARAWNDLHGLSRTRSVQHVPPATLANNASPLVILACPA